MNILLAALGFGPYVQSPTHVQFVTGLAKSLRLLGHEVSVAVPYLPDYEQAGLLLGRRLSPLELAPTDSATGARATVYDVTLASGVKLVLLQVSEGEFDPEKPWESQPEALGSFSRAVAELCAEARSGEQPFDIVHAHGAAAGLCLLHLDANQGLGAARVLSVHDASQRGDFHLDSVAALGIPEGRLGAHGFGSGDGLCLLKGLLSEADAVIAPSESYSRGLQAPERHGALARAFRAIPPRGVLSGVDLSIYNPSTDAALVSRYDAPDPSNKARNRSAVLSTLNLEFDSNRPLTFVEHDPEGDCSWQTVLSALPGLVRNGMNLVLSVPEALRPEFQATTEAIADQVHVLVAPESTLRRRLLAASDFYLSVRRQDPFGQQLLQAARYGAIPLAYDVDAVPDVVVDCDAELKTGSGFLYQTMTQRAVVTVAARAVAAYRNPAYPALLRRVMRRDFAWDRAARRHLQIYRQSAHL